MNSNLVIDRLKKEASTDPVVDAVLHAFALRKRARANLSVRVLYRKMLKEGYSFKRDDYGRVFKLFSDLGLGHLETNHSGRVMGLKDIRITLQSLGSAAVGKDRQVLRNLRKRNRYSTVAQSPITAPTPTKPTPPQPESHPTVIGLAVQVNDKTLSIPIPQNFNDKDIVDLVEILSHVAK